MKQQILDLINSNPFYTDRVIDATCKGKVYVVADLYNNKIATFSRVLKGAEFFIESRIESYTHYTHYNVTGFENNIPYEEIKIVEPLQIFEFDATEIAENVKYKICIKEIEKDSGYEVAILERATPNYERETVESFESHKYSEAHEMVNSLIKKYNLNNETRIAVNSPFYGYEESTVSEWLNG